MLPLFVPRTKMSDLYRALVEFPYYFSLELSKHDVTDYVGISQLLMRGNSNR